MKRLFACILAACVLTLTAGAAYVPDDIVSENLNGRQLIVKTYTLSPGDDPDALIEEPFEQDGYTYTYSDMVKEEHPFEERRTETQTVTVNTESKDLTAVLAALDATIPFDDGEFAGTLSLDHTTIKTEAAGYTSKSYTVSETKQIGGLDRNDPSYVPATTVKNGQTLSLSNISWSVEGTSLADGALIPTSYMATATYTGHGSSKVATGYITTAQYTGEVVSSGVSSIGYTVTYLGGPVPAPPFNWSLAFIIAGAVLLAGVLALVLFLLLRRNTKVYVMPAGRAEYALVSKQRLSPRRTVLDLRDVRPYPEREAVVEIRQKTARKLFGRLVTIRLNGLTRTHLIEQNESGNYWFTVSTQEEVQEVQE